MIDRFVTSDRDTVHRACEAMMSAMPFRTSITRDDRIQNWEGFVTKIERYGDGHRIEVNRNDI